MNTRIERLIRRAAMIRARRFTSAPVEQWVPLLENLDAMIARFAGIMIERKPSLPAKATWLRLTREAGGHVCLAVMQAIGRRDA